MPVPNTLTQEQGFRILELPNRKEGKRMGALDGLKVLDFSTLLPGPYATMMLADLGAEVLKVSGKNKYDLVLHWPPILQDTNTTAAAAWLGRNKKTIFLNLKKPAAVEAVKKLIAEYDILVEQFRPGVMKKLGLDYETLRKVNPRLIYCSLTGYGQTGPLKDKAGHDINYMARSGVMASAGRKATGPVLSNMQIADMAVGSMNTVVGILAAVYYRQRTGEGQYVDISMLDGMTAFNSMDGACFLARAPEPKREEQMLNGGGIYDFYETKDGGYMSVGSLEPKFFAQLCQGLGFAQWADGDMLKTHPQQVKEAFRARFKQKTRNEWSAIFEKVDACVEPVLSLQEAAADEHICARGMIQQVPLPQTPQRTVQQMGCPIKLSVSAAEYRHAGWPEGWHTQQVLEQLGYSQKEIQDMTE